MGRGPGGVSRARGGETGVEKVLQIQSKSRVGGCSLHCGVGFHSKHAGKLPQGLLRFSGQLIWL